MTDAIQAPLDLHREIVRPEWIDYNGHMNVAYYVLAFDRATDVWFEHLGLGDAYRARTGCSLFALELHVLYAAELKQGDPLRITTQLLGFDDKRLHFFHRMYHAETGTPSACLEIMGLNVEMAARKAKPFPADSLPRIEAVAAAHESLPRPPEAGRVIGLKRKSAG
jgi:acyl-CoA thioester hydrolase